MKLWRVTRNNFGKRPFCGGFEVNDEGIVSRSAPFLYKQIYGKSEKEALAVVCRVPGTKVELVEQI